MNYIFCQTTIQTPPERGGPIVAPDAESRKGRRNPGIGRNQLDRSPVGTAHLIIEFKQIVFIIFNPKNFQKFQIFLPKRPFLMMKLLIINIVNNILSL